MRAQGEKARALSRHRRAVPSRSPGPWRALPALATAFLSAACGSLEERPPPPAPEPAPEARPAVPAPVYDFDLAIEAVALIDATGASLAAGANAAYDPGFEGNRQSTNPSAYAWRSDRPAVLTVRIVNLAGESGPLHLRALWPPFSGVEAQSVLVDGLAAGEGRLVSFPPVLARPAAGGLVVDFGQPAPAGDRDPANDRYETPIFIR